jgi:PAS domain S-box-containing protein
MLNDFLKQIKAIQMIRTIGSEHKILAVDGILEDWWGYKSSKAIGSSFNAWISAHDLKHLEKLEETELLENGSYITHYKIQTQNEKVVWVREQASLLKKGAETYVQALISPASKEFIARSIDAQKYQAIADLSTEAILILDDFHTMDLNPSFEQMFGMHKKELIGQNILSKIISSEELSKVYTLIEDLKEKPKRSFSYKLYLNRKNGEQFWANLKACTVQVMGRQLLALSFVDLSSVKSTTQALIDSKERYKRLAQGSQEGIIIHDKGIILEANHKVSEILGASIEEMKGKSVLNFLPPSEHPQILQFLKENEQNPELKRNAILPVIDKNGAQLFTQISGSAIEIDGKIFRYVIIRDISEEYKIQKELEVSQKRYKELSDLTQEFIMIHDLDGRIVEVNDSFCRFQGMSEKELVGKYTFELLAPEMVQKHQLNKELLSQHYQKVPKSNGFFQLLNEQGEVRTLRFDERSFTKGEDKLRYVVMTDVTDMHEVQRRLEESRNKFKVFADATDEAISIHKNGILKEANRAYCELFQIAPEAIENFNALSLITPKDRSSIKAILKRYSDIFDEISIDQNSSLENIQEMVIARYLELAKQYPIPFPYKGDERGITTLPLQKTNGEVFTAESREGFIFLEGEVFQYQVIRDITGRLEAKRRLEESRNKYKTLADITQEAIVIHNLDGMVVEVNQAYCKLFKTSADNIIGKTGIEFIPTEELDRYFKLIQSNPKFQNEHKLREQVNILHFQDSDGKKFIAEAVVNYITLEGALLRYTLIRDITDIVETQRLLQESTAKYKRLADITQEAIIIHQNGKILEVNERTLALLGWSEEELIDQSVDDLINPQVLPQTQQPLQSEEQFRRVYLQKSNGENFVAEILESQLSAANQQMQYLVIRDITAQVHYEQRIEDLVYNLSEKNKQLNCLFEISRLSSNKAFSLDLLIENALEVIPQSWQHEDICVAKITFGNKSWETKNYQDTEWSLTADIKINGGHSGELKLCYLNIAPMADHGPFLRAELDLIEAIALQISTLIEKRLSEDRMIASVLEAEDRERTRIAKELHDSLGQLLMAISLNLESLKKDMEVLSPKNQTKLGNALNYLNTAIMESRHISHNLMPKAINDYGYVLAVQSMIEGLQTVDEIQIHFYDNLDGERLHTNLELSLFRITQEAITNILKHADAQNITIQLMKYPDVLLLTIEDDGKGFNYEAKQATKRRNFGLESIQNRAHSISAILTIESKAGHGTTIMVEVPI